MARGAVVGRRADNIRPYDMTEGVRKFCRGGPMWSPVFFSPSVCPTGSHLPRHTRPQAGVRERNRTECGS